MSNRLHPTLSSADYCAPAVYEIDRLQIFHAGWMYVCHVDALPAGSKRVVDIAGVSVLVTRDQAGTLHALANVCRHRGAELCDRAMQTATTGPIRCAYHAWTYALDGSLRATPRVDDEFDRTEYGLWRYHVDVWNGLVFVSVAVAPVALEEWLRRLTPAVDDFAGLPIDTYRVGARTQALVAANWKILIENYNECLHCAVVHPELVELIPVYRTGHVIDPERDDEVVSLASGARALTRDGSSRLSLLPGVADRAEYSGMAVFPNLMFDLTPTALALTALFPIAADRTLVVAEYLFHPDDVARPDFDPSPEVEMDELVGAQDFVVCEMVQRGVSSPAFTSGVLTAKDDYVHQFVERYLDVRGTIASD